ALLAWWIANWKLGIFTLIVSGQYSKLFISAKPINVKIPNFQFAIHQASNAITTIIISAGGISINRINPFVKNSILFVITLNRPDNTCFKKSTKDTTISPNEILGNSLSNLSILFFHLNFYLREFLMLINYSNFIIFINFLFEFYIIINLFKFK